MGSNITLMFETAVIIAGGRSSRMLQDKALLPFGGFTSLAEFQHERLETLFSKVYVSAKVNKFDFDVQLLEDVNKVSSPLVALVSIFERLEVDEVFVLSVDAPFVSEEVIKQLYAVNNNFSDAVVAESSNGLEPLCAIYKRSFLPKAKHALNNNEHRLQGLLKSLKIKKVFFEEEKLFMNLNYPKEYNEALSYIDEKH